MKARYFESTTHLKLTSRVEVLQSLSNTDGHGLLTLTNPDTRIEVLLVGLVLAIWVTDLLHDILLLVENVVTDTSQVSVLQVGIEVDLDNTIRDSIQELLL